MKKRILTSTALIALATASYAQLIQQVGQQQFAQHNQFGSDQTGTIEQRQNATPALNGVNYGNYAITFQGTPTNTGANNVSIQQNDGSQGNRVGISQDGGPNNAIVTQNGGIDGLSGGASSVSATIGAAGEDGNFAGIAQTGAGNISGIIQNNNSRRNSAETYQNGTLNWGLTNQSNNSIHNSALIVQGYSGPGVKQIPVNNAFAQIQQGRTSATDISAGSFVLAESVGNSATIIQTASNVRASIGQGGIPMDDNTAGRSEGNRAVIEQSAVLAQALIYQGAGGGEAIGSQAIINQSAVNNGAFIYQGVLSLGSTSQSEAIINQTSTAGITNAATIVQGFSGASEKDKATITQAGTVANSSAQILQGNAIGGYSSGDVAAITQLGKGSLATINQNSLNIFINNASGQSNGRDNNASIIQGLGVIGNSALSTNGVGGFIVDPTATGVALIDQGMAVNGEILEANRNTANINQTTGTGLRAHIAQGQLGATLTDAAGNALVISGLNGTPVALAGTIANDNTGTITQTSGDNHNANIFQNGRFNSAAVNQANGNGHQALIVQTANSQRAQAVINQTSSGTGNAATILQFAGSNADGVGQFGNIASISQMSGSNNVAFIQQGLQGSATSSNDNQANLTQNGSNNFARFLQVGNNNMVNITQNGNNNQVLNSAGDPGSYGSQIGYNNRLTLVQEGGNTGVTFKYTQIGNNNTQVVNQHF